nr:hypothetical protein CFP56_24326 [Quercus suber]
MEKLILRSVMYGADKIPDKWFDKVPGGFYKPQKEALKMERKKHSDNRRHHKSDRHHHGRRYSAGETSRGQRPKLEGYHSDGERRRHDHRARSSYDGGEDDEYSGDDRHRRRRHGADRRRRQSRNDNDRYGHRDGHESSPRDDYEDDHRTHRRGSPPADSDEPLGSRRSRNMDRYDPGDEFVADDAAQLPSDPMPSDQPPIDPNVYVPYANIYGGPKPTAVPPMARSVQPNGFHQVAPRVAPLHYQQNVDAQQAPTAAAAGAGAMYDGQPGWLYPEDPRWDPRYANARNESRSDHDDSVSEDRRSRRHDREQDHHRRTKSHGGRAKSKAKEMFDSSKRGLGYSALGGVAGGLAGNEVGSGKVPIGLGAAAGALGANALQARQRRKGDEREAHRYADGTHGRRENRRRGSRDRHDYHSD